MPRTRSRPETARKPTNSNAMKRTLLSLAALLITIAAAQARTLIVYYSFTNNTRTIATDLQAQIADADLVRIEPAEKGLDYAANGYAIGSALISAIRQNPDDATSYPAIDPVSIDFSLYDNIIVATPLWWSNMAAPMQTFLFNNGSLMAGKRIGLVVSSASSGISGVEADARRLVPNGDFVSPSLWIRSSQTSSCHALSAEWIAETGIGTPTDISPATMAETATISVSGGRLSAEGSFDRLELCDMTGRTVLSTTGNSCDVSHLQAGVYAVRIANGSNKTATKVIINK